MRWILLVFLLIGCTDNDDMKLFQMSLTSEIGTPPIDYKTMKTVVFDETLSSLPSDFIAGSNFSFSGGFLNGSGAGTLSTNSRFTELTYGDRQIESIDFKITDLTSKFGFVQYQDDGYADSPSLCEVDLSLGTFTIRKGFTYPTYPTEVLVAGNITIDININDTYQLYFEKDNITQTLRLLNLNTLESQSISEQRTDENTVSGIWRGYVSLFLINGNIDFSNMVVTNYYPTNPKVLIIGDSYVDGYSISSLGQEYLADRWTWQTYELLNGNCALHGWGGFLASDLILTEPTVLTPYTPEYVLIGTGLNDSISVPFATWQSNMESLILSVEAKGAEAILFTLPPATPYNQTFINSANAWVLGSGYRFVDTGKALSVNGDRVTIDNSKMLSDDAHPNTTGHDAIYQEYLTLGL